MLKNLRNLSQKYGSKALVVAAVATASTGAFAQETNPIIQLLNSIGLSGVQAAILAICVTIVAIALTMRGPVISKRVINKV